IGINTSMLVITLCKLKKKHKPNSCSICDFSDGTIDSIPVMFIGLSLVLGIGVPYIVAWNHL
ncbi:hypothetical protein R6258_18800, partial [Halomonas sp. HP20-15]|uniref:hypothetical protein n=1 Tax=Halomonas sp. HP20-15 TaxID=3085901 RepID=UPI002980DF72